MQIKGFVFSNYKHSTAAWHEPCQPKNDVTTENSIFFRGCTCAAENYMIKLTQIEA